MIQKYSAALVAVAITLVAALAQLTNGFHGADALQIVIVGVNAVVIYLAPTFGAQASSVVKTTAAVIVAIASALVPFFVQGGTLSGAQIAIVVLAGLQALGAHIGVQLRNEAAD